LNFNELIIKNTSNYFAEFPAKFQHHWVVSAVGGARGDFVANWIGSIQSHFNSNISNWVINDRGTSKASTKLFDYGHVYQGPAPIVEPKLLEQLTAHYDPTARQSVSKTHDDYSALHAVIPKAYHDKFTMLDIFYDVRDRDLRIKILWEMLCKTFFIQYELDNTDQKITQVINKFYPNDNIALETLVNKMCKVDVENFVQWGRRPVNSVGSLRRVTCDYSKIITVDGSRHLEQLLGIDIAPEYHELYAQRLATADSPDVIEFRGREWSRAELLSWAD
jgi:hypothetical protein